MPYKHVFGPVNSSRLGLSLGLDLLGDKICSYDCLYCESGPTRLQTMRRRPYAAGQEVLAELKHWWVNKRLQPDHITLGGLGEPCLNSDLGSIVSGIKKLVPDIPLAVLTNSSLLGSSLIRKELAQCQVILPSLDSMIPEEFWTLNRPVQKINPNLIAENILRTKQGFKGLIYLEILLVQGINDSGSNLKQMQSFCSKLAPDRLDVLTMTRPGAHSRAKPVDNSALEFWKRSLGASPAQAAGHSAKSDYTKHSLEQISEMVLNSLQRRPQTLQQLALALDLKQLQLKPVLQKLINQQVITVKKMGELEFFTLKRKDQA